MVTRRLAAVAVVLVFLAAPGAVAAQEAQPQAGSLLTGRIQFPHPQEMGVQVDHTDASKLTAYLGFDGRCRGRVSELWAKNVTAKPRITVRDGRFAATVTGVTRRLGGMEGRTASYRWRFVGRFVTPDVITATVSGSGQVRVRGRTIARCKIASPAAVRLTLRA
jgi:hypothetical protein